MPGLHVHESINLPSVSRTAHPSLKMGQYFYTQKSHFVSSPHLVSWKDDKSYKQNYNKEQERLPK